MISELMVNNPTGESINLSSRRIYLAESVEVTDLDLENDKNDIYQIVTKEAICSAGYYVGGMKKDALKASESRQLILGTFAMANEGLDIETLNCLILASPKSDVIQAVGRVLRKDHLEMKPKIVDMVDIFSMFTNQAGKRLKYYKTKGYVITNIDITDNGDITNTEKIEYSAAKPKSKPKNQRRWSIRLVVSNV